MPNRLLESSFPEEQQASFDISAISEKRFANAPPSFVIRGILALRRFLLKLADLVVPPDAAVFERIVGVGTTTTLGALTRLGIPDLLEDGPLTAKQIAARTNTNKDAIHRAMRGRGNYWYLYIKARRPLSK